MGQQGPVVSAGAEQDRTLSFRIVFSSGTDHFNLPCTSVLGSLYASGCLLYLQVDAHHKIFHQ